jgi:hypothetical protein
MRRRTWLGLAVGLALLVAASGVRAGETNPYLIGSWEDDNETIYTDFVILNPTTIALDVYAAFYDNTGAAIPKLCFKKQVGPNGKWHLPGLDLRLGEFDTTGTVKFIALPAGSTKKTPDSNAIIAGYQNRWVFEMTSSQVELRAVDLIFPTLGEFTNILNRKCLSLERPD